jgi:hypothetical protein
MSKAKKKIAAKRTYGFSETECRKVRFWCEDELCEWPSVLGRVDLPVLSGCYAMQVVGRVKECKGKAKKAKYARVS